MAPFIPKLQGHFAEFLNNASPAGLRILSASTCVGLRYGDVYKRQPRRAYKTCTSSYATTAPQISGNGYGQSACFGSITASAGGADADAGRADWNKIGYVSELSDFLQNILEDEAKDYGHLKIPSVH